MAEEEDSGAPFIDSHSHLADAAFDGDRGDVIERARKSGAAAVICIGSGSGAGDPLGAARASAALSSRYGSFVPYTAGVHPHDASAFVSGEHIGELRAHAGAGAVAIGECGLDYHYDNSPRESQRRAFAGQLALAAETALPVVVHTREAEDDTRAMVAEAAGAGVRGVLHCFTGSRALAEAAVEAGWYISFAGIVTFRKWTEDDLLRAVPDDRILAESDAPYLAPVPNRGRRNEPAWVPHTIARVALARKVTPAAMSARMTANARELFKLA